MKGRRAKLAALERIAGLMLDVRQAELRQAAAARDASLAALAALDRPAAVPAPETSPVATAQAAIRYEVWADRRRAEINLTLARQTARLEDARQAAAQAFGKTEALKALRRKAGP